MTTKPSTPADTGGLSAECAVARQTGPADLHDRCTQQDIPMPYARGVLLQARCTCSCHRSREAGT